MYFDRLSRLVSFISSRTHELLNLLTFIRTVLVAIDKNNQIPSIQAF